MSTFQDVMQGEKGVSQEQGCPEPVCREESPLEQAKNAWQPESGESRPEPHSDCPLSKQALGRHSWPLLHTMAAYYPGKPSEKQQTAMVSFIEGLSQFYPCRECRLDFQRQIKISTFCLIA